MEEADIFGRMGDLDMLLADDILLVDDGE